MRSTWLVVPVLVLVLGVGAAASEGTWPLVIDPANPEHQALFEPVFGTPWEVVTDPEGEPAFYMGTQLANIPTATYDRTRYVLLTDEKLLNPRLDLKSLGGQEGSGNPSHFIIFAWQDYRNFYYIYPAESVETRVARVVDGVHQTLYRHGEIIWVRDRDWYQDLTLEVLEEDGQRKVNTYVNGRLAMSYTFQPGEEPPAGRVGIGMWNLAHSAYIKDIVLTETTK